MSAAQMFGEFLQFVSDIASMFFISKYLWLYISIAVGLGIWLITFIVRWFNA